MHISKEREAQVKTNDGFSQSLAPSLVSYMETFIFSGDRTFFSNSKIVN
jgi:hypothetical protein